MKVIANSTGVLIRKGYIFKTLGSPFSRDKYIMVLEVTDRSTANICSIVVCPWVKLTSEERASKCKGSFFYAYVDAYSRDKWPVKQRCTITCQSALRRARPEEIEDMQEELHKLETDISRDELTWD